MASQYESNLPLAKGCCCCLPSNKNVNPSRRRKASSTFPFEHSLPSALILSQESPTWLCRWSHIAVGNSRDVSSGATLCFDTTVSIHSREDIAQESQDWTVQTKNTVMEHLWPFVNQQAVVWEMNLQALRNDSIVLSTNCAGKHSHATIDEIIALEETQPENMRKPLQDATSNNNSNNFSALALTIMPLPLQSLTLVIVNSNEKGNREQLQSTNVLQQSSWKRQLVGTYILFSKSLTSIIRLSQGNGATGKDTDVYLLVDSATTMIQTTHSQRQQQRQRFMYVILPSTRIVIQSTTTTEATTNRIPHIPSYNNNNNHNHKTPTPSPVTQLLLETIFCMAQNNQIIPRSFLLSGPPGVGKTFAVKKVLELSPFPIHLVSLRGSELLLPQSGRSTANISAAQALKREFYKAAAATTTTQGTKIALVFLDECDALVSVDSVASMLATLLDEIMMISTTQDSPTTTTTTTSHDTRNHVLKGKNNILVVAATNRVDSIPDYLRRAGRFDKEIPMAPPNAKERAAIMTRLLLQTNEGDNMTFEDEPNVELMKGTIQRLAELCVGYVPADLHALIRRAMMLSILHSNSTQPSSIVNWIESAMSDVGASALRDASLAAPPKITWEDIAGDPGGAKTALRQAIEWPRTKASAFARLGLVPPRGILLHGPPGCAKTTLARAAAGSSGVAFLSLSPAEVYASSYVGEAEAVVRRAFTLARSAAPCILFFDEIDSIFGGVENGGRGNSAEARVLSTFLNEMDGVDNNRGADGVLVLGATNRPWTLDSALLRPGRLGDKIIYIPPPDSVARRAILTQQFGHDSPLDLDWLASDAMSGLMTGAELVGACQTAKLELVRQWSVQESLEEDAVRLQQGAVAAAIQSIKPLLSDQEKLEEFRLFEQSAVKG